MLLVAAARVGVVTGAGALSVWSRRCHRAYCVCTTLVVHGIGHAYTRSMLHTVLCIQLYRYLWGVVWERGPLVLWSERTIF